MSDGVEILEVAVHSSLLDVADNGWIYTALFGQLMNRQASASTRRTDSLPE